MGSGKVVLSGLKKPRVVGQFSNGKSAKPLELSLIEWL